MVVRLTLQVGILSLLVFSPLAFGSVETWSRSATGIVILILTGLWIAHRGFRGVAEDAMKFPWALAIPAALFLGWIVLQLATGLSLNVHDTWAALLMAIAYASFFILVATTVSGKNNMNGIVLFLIFLGFGISLFAILQMYAWNGKIYWIRDISRSMAYGPFVNRNHLAGYLELLIPVGMGYIVGHLIHIPAEGKTRWIRFWRRLIDPQSTKLLLIFFLVLVMTITLFLTLSRSGILSFLSGMAVMGGLLMQSRRGRAWRLTPVILVATVLLCLTWFGISPLVDRFMTLRSLDWDRVMMLRSNIWEDTTHLISDHSVMGTGLGTFEKTYPAYKTFRQQVQVDHAHNDYVQLMAETGWVGFGIAMVVLVILARAGIGGLRKQQDPRSRYILLGMLIGMLSFLIHGLSDFNFHIPSNALLFITLTALTWSLLFSGQRERLNSISPGFVGRIGAGFGLVVVVWLLYQILAIGIADHHYRAGLRYENDKRFEDARDQYRMAIEWDGRNAEYHFAMAKIHERNWLMKNNKEALDLASGAIEEAVSQASTVSEYRLHLGWILAQQRDREGATKMFKKVLELDPTNANWHHYVGLWFASIGEKKSAMAQAQSLRGLNFEGKAEEIEALF